MPLINLALILLSCFTQRPHSAIDPQTSPVVRG
jgi:hypothetical protein